MCHDLVSKFSECDHTIESGVFECSAFFRNGSKHCDPKNEPKELNIQGKCVACKHDESNEAIAEIERAMEASMREHEAYNRQHNQHEQEEEQQMRAALEVSLDVPPVQPHGFDEDDLSKAISESLRSPQNSTVSTREYLWLAYSYLGCGHTVRAYMTPIEREPGQPEAMVEEASGTCPDCRGEGSAASASAPRARPGLEDEDDPVPAYDPGSLMDELMASGSTSSQAVALPHEPLDTTQAGSASRAATSAYAEAGQHGAQTEPSPHGDDTAEQSTNEDAAAVARTHWAQQPVTKDSGHNSSPSATSDPNRQASSVGIHYQNSQLALGGDEYQSSDEDYESDDEPGKSSSITRSTASRLFRHMDHNQPRYKGDPNSELEALAEEDEDVEGNEEASRPGHRAAGRR